MNSINSCPGHQGDGGSTFPLLQGSPDRENLLLESTDELIRGFKFYKISFHLLIENVTL